MKKLMILLFSAASFLAKAQDTGMKRYLYGDSEIPGATKSVAELSEQDKPKLFAHQADQPNTHNLVFLVIPGGGYGFVAMDHEGHQIANRLNGLGYAAYVLEYRLPKVETMKDKRFAPLQDAQVAINTIRKENKGKKVVVIGFSAGGHLAASLSTLFNHPQVKGLKPKAIRPDYAVLCYPVISMLDAVTHNGSKQNLLGPNVAETDVAFFSTEKQVSKKSQPTFLMSAKDDQAVPIQNSYLYQESLNKYKIPNTLFTYEEGGHGFGLHNKTSNQDWFAAMISWIEAQETK